MSRRLLRVQFGFLVLLSLAAVPSPVFAHGANEAAGYELTVGFLVEPAYVGQLNGLDLVVSEAGSGNKIDGLAGSLKAEVILGEERRELALEPQAGRAGAYTAPVLPTLPGNYAWRIVGEVKGTPIDVTLEPGPDTFDPVLEAAELDFPPVSQPVSPDSAQSEPPGPPEDILTQGGQSAGAELPQAGGASAAQAQPGPASTSAEILVVDGLAATRTTARIALALGAVAILLGALGLVVGLLGLRRRGGASEVDAGKQA